MNEERQNFGGRLAGILVAAGSAVGLGNIWRFPYEMGRNGGAAFLIVYALCVLAFGLPLMVSEFAIGRHSQANTARAYGMMGGSKYWKWVGMLGIITATMILCYYGVAAGWTVQYLFLAGIDGFANKSSQDFINDFNEFVSSPLPPVVCMMVFMAVNMAVILAGVKKGIEKGSKIMMPLLFVCIIILACVSVSLDGAEEGVRFLLKPDFSKVTHSTLLSAMGQTFYSLSLSMGCLCTYASYFRKEDKLVSNSINVSVIDTLVAVLAVMIIFPAAFSVGIQPDAGPSLVFITLPNVFQRAFGAEAWIGYIFSLMFYLLLCLATLTSAMGLLEVPTIYLREEFHIRRRWSAMFITFFCVIVGIVCSLSMGMWSGFTVAGMNFFDLFDFVTAKLMLPIGGFLTAIYCGWACDQKQLYDEVTNQGAVARWFWPVYLFLIRFVAPIGIVAIFLNQFGII